jgi:hypothetical protein
MTAIKSLDESEIIAALLADAHASLGVFNTKQLRNTQQWVRRRYLSEGVGFLTKTMPRLGKHFDQALTGGIPLNAATVRFKSLPNSQLPRFLGELFQRVFHQNGLLLPDPDVNCVKHIRQILYLFYKYELPYDEEQEQQVISAFKQAEVDLSEMSSRFAILQSTWHSLHHKRIIERTGNSSQRTDYPSEDSFLSMIVRKAKRNLSILFNFFDPTDITPSHGPGVVATKQRLWDKFLWTNVSSRITALYPFDAYFCASLGHVCDVYRGFDAVKDTDHSAQVLLVPKDSRGPRLISCEPVDFQWIQQGLRRAIYRLVENHPITKWNVFFTNQQPNQLGALLGSKLGKYATLDLKEASDRVHVELVRLLFPEKIFDYLACSRSTSTVLPDGTVVQLSKYAPMGSALCFPIMALTIWALLTAASPDADTRESVLVYGDDVIVPTAFAESAIAVLESFGLKVNRDKSCFQGLFRESCGVDAFQGINVTPVRLRTVWNESPRPDVYTSWISYANAMWDRRYYLCHEYIVTRLEAVYGPIPSTDMSLDVPSLQGTPSQSLLFRRRYNKALQKVQYKVRDVKARVINKEIPGWSMLLRWFTEKQRQSDPPDGHHNRTPNPLEVSVPLSVSQYTRRHTSKLVWRWR